MHIYNIQSSLHLALLEGMTLTAFIVVLADPVEILEVGVIVPSAQKMELLYPEIFAMTYKVLIIVTMHKCNQKKPWLQVRQ